MDMLPGESHAGLTPVPEEEELTRVKSEEEEAAEARAEERRNLEKCGSVSILSQLGGNHRPDPRSPTCRRYSPWA